MNMKWFKKYALPAVLAAVVPITANAATYKVPDVTMTNPAVAGKSIYQISGTNVSGKVWHNVLYFDGSGTDIQSEVVSGAENITTKSNIFDIGKIDISTNAAVTNFITGVSAAFDETGTYNLKDISISSSGSASGTITGFQFSDAASDTFSGKILGKANITIDSAMGDVDLHTLYGVRFAETDVKSDPSPGAQPGDMVADPNNVFAGTAEFGTITIKNGKVGALGIDVGDVAEGASITADKIDVSSTGNAIGLNLQAPVTVPGTDKGTIKIGEITASSDQYAVGVIAGLQRDFSATGNSDINIELGKVDVVAKAGDAYGISGANLTNIKLTDDVTATSETGDGYGINSESVVFTVAEGKTVNISGSGANGAGIKATATAGAGGGVWALLEKGSTLDVDVVDVRNGGALVTEGYGKAKIGGIYQGAGGYVSIWDETAVELNLDNSWLQDEANTLYVDKTASLVTTTDAKNTDDVAAMADKLANKLGYNAGEDVGLVELFSDAAIYQFDGKGGYTNRGVGLTNGFVAAASMHQRYSAWNATRDQMISASSNRRGFLGQECDPCDPVGACDPCDPCGTYGGGIGKSLARNAWVNYVGRADEYSTPLGDKWKLGMDGVQVGTDLYKTSRNQFGVIFGYEGGDLVSNRSQVEGDDIYAGFYGAHVFNNGFDLRGTFAYGWQDYKMVRQAFGAGTLYGSKFDGTTTESTVELGKRFFNGNWSMRPVFGIDVMSNELDKAQEYDLAGNAGYTYGKTDFTQVFLRTGTDLRWQLRRLTFNSGIYYSYDVDGDNLLAQAKWDANTAPITLAGSDMGRELLTFNVGGEYQFNNFSVFGGYQGQAVLDTKSDAYQSIGYVGGAWKW